MVIPSQNCMEGGMESLSLELHHVNGNNKDNRLDNIKLLCSNCHALTDNYRNRK